MRLAEGWPAAVGFQGASATPLVTRWISTLDELAARSPEEVDGWQRDRLRRVLRVARRFVPAYSSGSYASSDLSDAPILTKDDVRARARAFRNPLVPARRVTTGGTNGRPLVVNVSWSSFFSEWAHIAYTWRGAGIGLTDPKLTFRGSNLGRGFGGAPIVYQRTYNHFAVSPFHLNDDVFRRLVAEIGDFRPRAIWGYPSSITPFARWVERTGPHRQLAWVDAVLLASESPFDWQVRLFEDVFGARVVRWYGQSEKVAFAAGCPSSPGYHVLPTYGIVEEVDGRILGTGFTNAAMPLVRYDTEDTATFSPPDCGCGLPFPFLGDVDGRWDQAILWGSAGEEISTTSLNFHDPIFMSFDRFQFRQEVAGHVTLLVTHPEGEVSGPLLESARLALQRRVGDSLEIEVRLTAPEGLLSQRGKAVLVDQRIAKSPS